MMSRTPQDPHLRAPRTRSPVARALTSGLCATLASAIMATSIPAAAAAATTAEALPLLRLAPEDAPASVLGLDSKDTGAGKKLTTALRKAFANRGLSGGEEISLEEMRLTMGCTNDGVACLAEGGKTLGVRRLVFGYLGPSGKGYQLDIQILDVDAGTLESQASMELSKRDLSDGNIDATATTIVNTLMPAQEADADLPPRPDPLPDIEPDPEPEPEQPPREDSKIWFGLEKPTPRWKWAAFGTSLALTLAAAGVSIGTAVWINAKDNASWGFRPDLIKAAQASLSNDSAFNRVDPMMSGDLCEYNRRDDNGELLMAGDGPGARDVGVGNVCNKGQDRILLLKITGAATGVFGLTTLVFTGVLLIHKNKPSSDAMLRRGLRLGVAPRPEGGLTFGGRLRF